MQKKKKRKEKNKYISYFSIDSYDTCNELQHVRIVCTFHNDMGSEKKNCSENVNNKII